MSDLTPAQRVERIMAEATGMNSWIGLIVPQANITKKEI